MKKRIVCLFILIAFISCNNGDPGTKVRISSLTESVYASGTVKAEKQYNVFATISGILKEIYVSEGDSVKKGVPLFRIENQAARLNTENARLAVELASQNVRENSNRLRELELSVNVAREKSRNDSLMYLRQKNLWEKNIGSKVDLEQRRLAYETSRSAHLSASSRFVQAKLQFQTEYRQAQNNLKINKELQSNFTVVSETDGRVYQVLKEPGELVTPQAPLAVIGRASDFILELQVDEYDIARIKKDQRVLITMDSYKGQVFEAQISKIYPIMDDRSRTFQVDAVFTKRPPELYPNLTAEANIIIQTKKNVKIIPREYLIDDRFVNTDPDKKQRTPVRIGVVDYRYAEIISGLDTGQYVYKP